MLGARFGYRARDMAWLSLGELIALAEPAKHDERAADVPSDAAVFTI